MTVWICGDWRGAHNICIEDLHRYKAHLSICVYSPDVLSMNLILLLIFSSKPAIAYFVVAHNWNIQTKLFCSISFFGYEPTACHTQNTRYSWLFSFTNKMTETKCVCKTVSMGICACAVQPASRSNQTIGRFNTMSATKQAMNGWTKRRITEKNTRIYSWKEEKLYRSADTHQHTYTSHILTRVCTVALRTATTEQKTRGKNRVEQRHSYSHITYIMQQASRHNSFLVC